jgi:hypothetical protein
MIIFKPRDIMPDDLPSIIFWRLQAVLKSHTTIIVLTSLPRRKVESIASSGATNAPIVRPNIPLCADAWRIDSYADWQPLATIPKHWLPFLQRV